MLPGLQNNDLAEAQYQECSQQCSGLNARCVTHLCVVVNGDRDDLRVRRLVGLVVERRHVRVRQRLLC